VAELIEEPRARSAASRLEVAERLEGAALAEPQARKTDRVLEQKREGRLIRPTARDTGPGPRAADSVNGAAPA
jgi:hypothetical protein